MTITVNTTTNTHDLSSVVAAFRIEAHGTNLKSIKVAIAFHLSVIDKISKSTLFIYLFLFLFDFFGFLIIIPAIVRNIFKNVSQILTLETLNEKKKR